MEDDERANNPRMTPPPRKRGRLIACSGKAGSGKDTVGAYLERHKSFTTFSFACALKQIVSIVFDWPLDTLLARDDETRKARELLPSRVLGGKTWNYRNALQIIGTELFRHQISETIWTEIVATKIEPLLAAGEDVVITDARFITELDMIKAKGGVSILLWRKESDLVPLPGEHISENEFLSRKDAMTVIGNTTDSKEDLYEKIDFLLLKMEC